MSSENNGGKIATVTAIIICYYKLHSQNYIWITIPSEFVGNIIASLVLNPDEDTLSCSDFDYVKSLLNEATTKDVIAAFQYLCSYFSPIDYIKNAQWLYALPLIHFLKQRCEPFANPPLDPEKIVWDDEHLPLLAIEKSAQQGTFK